MQDWSRANDAFGSKSGVDTQIQMISALRPELRRVGVVCVGVWRASFSTGEPLLLRSPTESL